MRHLRALLLLAILAWPSALLAQMATLVADRIHFDGTDTVIAEGNVEILYKGQRVLARRLTYNRRTDKLLITGRVTLIEQDGAVMTAEGGTLDGDLQAGIMQGARLLLDGQLQLAAVEIHRVGGRYNQLYKAVASSCRVCGGKAPLWQIRARRIIHDQQARRLYFENARFEVAGIPVAYFPRLRTPDPTVKRATGFLTPEIKTSSVLGAGLKFPYFITLGRHADMRLTPYVSKNTRTVEGRFRQAFRFGSVEVNGAVSSDKLAADQPRAYVFAEGRFRLPLDFRLNVDLRLTTDEAYLLTYGYSDSDRLSSGAELTRTRRHEYISVGFETLQSLRSGEIPIEDTLATLLGRATYERRVFPGLVGGEARFVFDLEGHERRADTITPALAAACATAGTPECTARDVLRAGTSLGWRRDWLMRNGMIAAFDSALAADYYWINQDTSYAARLSHLTPTAAVELRWPLRRMAASGASDVFEPAVQLAWTDAIGANVPNDDSALVEFDEGNLLALSRFPGSDRYERGWRTTVGASWTRITPQGRALSLTAGRVFRADDLGQFTAASGLDGKASDWLVGGRFQVTENLTISNRALFDNGFNFAKNEARVTWSGARLSASGAYTWVVSDPAEGRNDDTSEIAFDAAYGLTRHWTAGVKGRFDVASNRATSAGFGLKYRNECLNVDLSLSRRLTSSTNVSPTTDVGLKVSLNGFGRDGRAFTRSCQVKS